MTRPLRLVVLLAGLAIAGPWLAPYGAVQRFDDRDVVRHKLVQAIVKAYEAAAANTGDSAARG